MATYSIKIHMAGNTSVCSVINNTGKTMLIIAGTQPYIHASAPNGSFQFLPAAETGTGITTCAFLGLADGNVAGGSLTAEQAAEYLVPVSFFTYGYKEVYIKYLSPAGTFETAHFDRNVVGDELQTITFCDSVTPGLASLTLSGENLHSAAYNGATYTQFPASIPLSASASELSVQGRDAGVYAKVNGVWVRGEALPIVN